MRRTRPTRISQGLVPAAARPATALAIVVVAALAITLACSLAYGGPGGPATDLRLFRAGGWLHAEVRARDLLDERTRLTIESGLPGTCLFQVRVEDRSGRTIEERYVERTLRFDLWENRYLLEGDGEPIALPTREEADSAFSHVADCRLAALTRLSPSGEYRVVVQIAVRPLAPEDRQRLSRYVSRTSGGGGEEVALDLGVVFGRILGEKSSSRPTVRHAGPYFRVETVPEQP